LTLREHAEVVRDSPALRTLFELASRGAATVVYDPAVRLASLPEGSRLVSSALEAAQCDVLLVLTEWSEFSVIPPVAYAASVRRRIIIDGCNVLDSTRVTAAGLIYRGVGRMSAVTSDGPAFAAVMAV